MADSIDDFLLNCEYFKTYDTEETYVVLSRMRGRRFPGVRRNVLEAAASDARGILLRAT